MRLSQQEDNSRLASVNKKDQKAATASAAANTKLKASNFPASILQIGTWKYKSRYEGGLVAKCYFAKHKLVWEVLDGCLKNKIEIPWSDIMALKADYPEDGPGTLEVVLARRPLFFREINPQPRKHTFWQATSDFTSGQASIQRRHFLQCPQGLLGKHFEKLIQCDPRLNFFSQQPDMVLDSPYFEPRNAMDDQIESTGVDRKSEEQAGLFGLQDGESESAVQSSLCCLLQKDHSTQETKVKADNGPDDADGGGKVTESNATLSPSKAVESKGRQQDDASSTKQGTGISRKESVGDLLVNLPRIASLPTVSVPHIRGL